MTATGVRRVLVADDDDDIVELLRLNLEAHGYEVLAASTGVAAVHTARDQLPDLIVLDWMMPEMDGLEALNELKGDGATRHIPIVMLTARTGDTDVWEGWQAGADVYLTKPFDLKELMRFIGYLQVNSSAAPAER